MKTKLDPQVFRDAMVHINMYELIACCDAIRFSPRNINKFDYTDFIYDRLGLTLANVDPYDYWWDMDYKGYTARIIALELCALMLEDEQKKIKKKSRGKKSRR